MLKVIRARLGYSAGDHDATLNNPIVFYEMFYIEKIVI